MLEQDYQAKELQVQLFREKISALHQEENASKERLFSLATEKANIHNEQNRLSSCQNRCQTQILSLNKELTKLTTQRAPLQEELLAREQEQMSLLQKKNDTAARQESIRTAVAELTAAQAKAHERHVSLKEKTASLESKKQTLLEWEQKDPQRTAIRTLLSLELPGLRGPLGSLVRIQAGAEDIVGSALGEKLTYMLCDNVQVAQQAIKYLEDNGLGRVTFIVMDRLPDHTAPSVAGDIPGARSLLSLIQFPPELEQPVRFICGETLISARTIYGHALVQGGGQMTFDSHVLIDETMRQIQTDLEATAQEIITVAQEENTLQETLLTTNIEKSAVDLEFQRVTVQIEWIEGQLTTQKEQIQFLDKEIALNQNDIQAQETEEKGIVEQMTAAAESLAKLEAEEQAATVRQQQIITEVQSLRDEEALLAPLMTEAKVTWATKASDLSSRQREEEKLHETTAALLQRLEHAREELAADQGKIAEQLAIQKTESEKLQDFHQEQEVKDQEIKASLEERHDIISQLEKNNSTLQMLRQQIDALSQETHQLQMEARSFELQNQTMEQRLTEEHTLAFAEVKDEYANAPTDEEEIQRLRRKLESMGPVNLAAPEEYANLEERYNFLLTQQQDLIKEKEDLHQVITKINETTREHFKKTFEQVRENFRTIYHQLFEGGEADIVLTDQNNLLESGVDMVAQPPGKKLQNITLLSGGEKALTAIALLFAFFMVRPSPFCILDEVDAPLDDANVGRYINMVKSFSSQSQFLIITHNKRTMGIANILYGVTMEELGVSKIISVRLQKEDLAATA